MVLRFPNIKINAITTQVWIHGYAHSRRGAYRALLLEESYAVNGRWEKEGHFLQKYSHLQQGALAAVTLMKLIGKEEKGKEGKGELAVEVQEVEANVIITHHAHE